LNKERPFLVIRQDLAQQLGEIVIRYEQRLREDSFLIDDDPLLAPAYFKNWQSTPAADL
jgi:hypothetical protein